MFLMLYRLCIVYTIMCLHFSPDGYVGCFFLWAALSGSTKSMGAITMIPSCDITLARFPLEGCTVRTTYCVYDRPVAPVLLILRYYACSIQPALQDC